MQQWPQEGSPIPEKLIGNMIKFSNEGIINRLRKLQIKVSFGEGKIRKPVVFWGLSKTK